MRITSPILLLAEEILLIALVFLEWPRTCGLVGESTDFTCPSAVLLCPAVGAIRRLGRVVLFNGC